MKLLWICVCAVLATTYAFDQDDLIKKVNEEHTTWKAGNNFDSGIPHSFLKQLAGVRKDFNDRSQIVLEIQKADADVGAIKLPKHFDAREAWPHCPSIGRITDQSGCGSCWAVSVASVLTDRMCIFNNVQVNISAEDLLSCCDSCGKGCEGGYPQKAFQYFVVEGLVTGGFYGSNKGCKPYSIAPCRGCEVDTPECSQKCNAGHPKPYKQDKYYGRVAYQIEPNEKDIMGEIYRNGPVEAGFTVYDDFFVYKSGVYQHVKGFLSGRHAVKVIGWGEEEGVKYWLVVNSYGKQWGDHGMFKIRRGNNECGFESQINAGIPS